MFSLSLYISDSTIMPGNYQNSNCENQKIDIVFLSSRNLSDDEWVEKDDEEEEDEEFDFNPNTLSSKQPKRRMVTMKILPQAQEVQVKCRLARTWSWLQARIKLKNPPTSRYGAEQQIRNNQFSVLEYELNPSKGQQGRLVINRFITDICSNKKLIKEDSSGLQEKKERFNKYLSEQPPSDLYLGRL